MCGIVGYIGKPKPLTYVLNGLKNLEYRGYDSAGIAYLANGLNIIKTKGKISVLEEKIDKTISSSLSICHTRWATHGLPNNTNSHPHKVGKITIVHNGILENYKEIKEELIKDGIKFKSETDTEVISALINKYYIETNNIEVSIRKFLKKGKGSYALLIIVDNIEKIYIIKKESPLIIGLEKEGFYIASDVPAILEYTNKYILLEDNEYGIITKEKYEIFDINGEKTKKEIKEFETTKEAITKNGFEHFMLKEIHESEEVCKETFKHLLNNFETLPDLTKYNKIDIVGCGSTYNVALLGKYLIEKYAQIEVNVDISSEYRYKHNFIDKNSLVIFISQSGETADTLAAVKKVKDKCDTLGIINVISSSIARETKKVIYTKAGIEVSVATTKAYLSQLITLTLIAIKNALIKKLLTKEEFEKIKEDIKELPIHISTLLNKKEEYKTISKEIAKKDDAYYIGRSIDYALTLEAALKLKEVSYIHTEGYASGELKHGTISLIEESTPVIGIITDLNLKEKTISNLKEVHSRGAKVITISTEKIEEFTNIIIPKTNEILQSILTIIPLQLIAYETAKLHGCDIDKPKNLAKSVTVE